MYVYTDKELFADVNMFVVCGSHLEMSEGTPIRCETPQKSSSRTDEPPIQS